MKPARERTYPARAGTTWAMKPAILAGLLLSLTLCGPAAAHHSTTSRVHNMREIALEQGRDTTATCGISTMDMPIINVDGLERRTGHVAEFAHAPEDGVSPPYHDCRILLNRQEWPTDYLCRVLAGHEYLHAMGWTAAEGEEYQGTNGGPCRCEPYKDYHHSRDPGDIMWPFTLQPWAPCENGAAAP